jgi:environmental stress-induced protein Ves
MSAPGGGAARAGATTSAAARIVALADIAPRPWRNGAGRTCELLAWPDASAWQVRVSVAEIDRAAPFSSFPGVERWFAVVDGAGVELRIEGTSHRLVPGHAPLRFDGEASVEGRPIAGPTRDLNLMLRDSRGEMFAVADRAFWRPEAAACGLFTAVAGRWSAVDDGGRLTAGDDLPALTLLWLDRAPSGLRFDVASGRDGDAVPRTRSASGPIGWWLGTTPSKEATR